MFVVRALWSVAAVLLALLFAPPARAQSIDEILDSGIDRSTSNHDDEKTRLKINYNDCRDDDELTFEVGVRDFSEYNLEVWASTSGQCDVDENRRDNNKGCWFIYTSHPTNVKVSVTIPVRNIIAQSTTITEVVEASAEVCETKDLNAEVTLWFMLTSSGDIQGEAQQWKTTVDILGPIAPTEVSVDSGEEALFLSWNAEEASADRSGYDIYCMPLDTETAVASVHQMQEAAGAAGDAGASGGGAGSATGGAGGDAGSSGAGASSGGTSGSAGTDAAGAAGETTTGNEAGASGDFPVDESCPAATGLTPGQRPPANLVPCGHSTSLENDGVATGLQNGVAYAVAVATVDELENHGKLSNVVCGVPVVVEDFFEIYRANGGKGGGGFCGLSLNRSNSFGALAMLGLLLGLIFIRRRES